MHFPNVNITVEALFLFYSQEKCGAFFSYNLHKKIRVPHLWRIITWSIWDPSVFKMAAKSEFSKNHKKIRFVDISEISPERYITGHKETIESLKNRVNFPESCPLNKRRTRITKNLTNAAAFNLIAWNSSDCFESFSSLNNVWIDRLLMPSSDVTHYPKTG